MTEDEAKKHIPDKRSEPREISKKFHSVEMKLASLPIYLFKLKDISPNGGCFLVKEGSAILKHLEIGQILNMKYHAENEAQPSEIFSCKIKHITQPNEKSYKGHYLVGIKMLEKQDQHDL
jgi:hypothetical protein